MLYQCHYLLLQPNYAWCMLVIIQNHKNGQICKILFYLPVFCELSMNQLNILLILSTKWVLFFPVPLFVFACMCKSFANELHSRLCWCQELEFLWQLSWDPALVNTSVKRNIGWEKMTPLNLNTELQVISCCTTASLACCNQKQGNCMWNNNSEVTDPHEYILIYTKNRRRFRTDL